MTRNKRRGCFDVGMSIILYPISYLIRTHRLQKEIEAENEVHLQELARIDQEMDDWVDSHPIMEIFRSDCGDVVLTDIIREPDLTAVLCVFTENYISKPYKRKIKKDSKGYYILLDGHKTYFQKEHKQFNSNF